MEITTPTGMMTGLMMLLPIVSERSTNATPIRALNGSWILWSPPTTNLAICGATRPTNPITPVKLTNVAARNATMIPLILRSCFTFTPNAFALSSPEDAIIL